MSDSEAWRGEGKDLPIPLFSIFGMREPTPEERAAFEKARAERQMAAQSRALFVKPFSLHTACVKCGSSAPAWIRHCAGGDSSSCFDGTAGHEHLHRTCRRCRFVWFEWPLDSEVPTL